MPQYPVSGWQPDMTDGYASVRPLYGLWRLFWSKNLMGHGKSRKRNRESFLWLLMAYGENNRKTGELK